MKLSSDDYYCVRCNGAFKWEQLKQTPSGNLFCSPCWGEFTDEPTRRCPVDNSEMQKKRVMDLFNIDQCPTCDGVWFDKGELRVLQEKAKEEGHSEGFLLGFIL